MTLPNFLGVGVSWWNPEEILWLIRSRSINHSSRNDKTKHWMYACHGGTMKKYLG
jgi:hypothetical protein